ncbi:hypothetical protein [Loktanella sp. R86503]|uniref:hypothetical protein n=1 Tax=Loktanella sp. R86503 TaxID=3093847 RepID=UPI0036DD75C1
MASQHPAPSEAEQHQQQGANFAPSHQTGTPVVPQFEQQQTNAPIFRDFASI